MKSILLLFTTVFTLVPAAQAQVPPPEIIPLWVEGAPDAVGNEGHDRPTLTVYEPATGTATGTAVVIFPGGGYGHLAMDHEGHAVAKWLNSLGITAFILKYRHAPAYRHPTPLRDAQRAIRMVRHDAGRWGVNPEKIGVLGFSAGGHLASTTGTHFNWQDELADDAIGQENPRPDFMVLVYPVITMTEDFMHRGSRNNLLGENASEDMAAWMSSEKQVSAQTPPAFLIHTTTDTGVPPENSVFFYLAMREAGVDAEMHIYEQGPHGFGLGADDPILSTWPERCAAWLRQKGF